MYCRFESCLSTYPHQNNKEARDEELNYLEQNEGGRMNDITSWHSYPSVFTLGHRYLAELLKDDVLVEEKIDGSQFSFGKFQFGNEPEGLRCRSKGCQLNVEYPEKMFACAVNNVKEVYDRLHLGWTYRAEYLGKPKHNSLAYERVPHRNLIIFDINTNEEEYLSYEKKSAECERLGFECMPKMYYGKIDEPKQVLEYLERQSILGGQKVEGVVIKNYFKFGQDKKCLMGKYVSEAFKEVHAREWKNSNPSSGDIIDRLILEYKTPARWNKSVLHLKERGKIEGTPKDIGLLIKEAQQDIIKECEDELKQKLFDWAKGHILRGCVGGIAEWYKEELLKEQFK